MHPAIACSAAQVENRPLAGPAWGGLSRAAPAVGTQDTRAQQFAAVQEAERESPAASGASYGD